ncbi:hypothetical protein PV10_05221 [Exophiala mesophila]|uniref:Uncharacterized protein n=1 Tax=Exophiala mesophila TaxID=212818 RepID=A0A0D1ZJH1_EXOME|nr:uncharacterized protein PV10_05221 [Exophiala mesophila]KIV94064.1 hypothetical protein PV10_05221 [Exophiala mesophila]
MAHQSDASNQAGRSTSPLAYSPATFGSIGSSGSMQCAHDRAEQDGLQEAKNLKEANDGISEDKRGHTLFKDYDPSLIVSSDVLSLGLAGQEYEETYFSNAAAARQYRSLLLGGKTPFDPTIPTTDRARRAHVKALFIAFKTTANCGEAEALQRLFKIEHHDNLLVEARCWEIYAQIEAASRFNDNIVEAYEPHKYKYKKHGWNFATRFDKVCEVLASTKSIAKRCFDAPFLVKLIDDPPQNKARTESNRKLNAEKSVMMKRGREAMGEEPTGKRRKTGATQKTAEVATEPQTPEVQRQETATEAMPRAMSVQRPPMVPVPETPAVRPVGLLPEDDPEYARQAAAARAYHQMHAMPYRSMGPPQQSGWSSAIPRPGNFPVQTPGQHQPEVDASHHFLPRTDAQVQSSTLPSHGFAPFHNTYNALNHPMAPVQTPVFFAGPLDPNLSHIVERQDSNVRHSQGAGVTTPSSQRTLPDPNAGLDSNHYYPMN